MLAPTTGPKVVSLKGDSYRLRNRDLGRVPAPRTAGEE